MKLGPRAATKDQWIAKGMVHMRNYTDKNLYDTDKDEMFLYACQIK
ncbi:MAG TPA: hypothetical protein VJ729_15365 [Nitrososphaeraceae archaeon]|nr:hypothetical protein [Nitrososphaeraceae archaeon]